MFIINKKRGSEQKKKWNWKLTEIMNSELSENEIGNIINEKLASIIIILEQDSKCCFNFENTSLNYCDDVKKNI